MSSIAKTAILLLVGFPTAGFLISENIPFPDLAHIRKSTIDQHSIVTSSTSDSQWDFDHPKTGLVANRACPV